MIEMLALIKMLSKIGQGEWIPIPKWVSVVFRVESSAMYNPHNAKIQQAENINVSVYT